MIDNLIPWWDGEDDEVKFRKLMSREPKNIKWITQPKQRWVVTFNNKTFRKTNYDTFSSELIVFNYPIGMGESTVPKKFLVSDTTIRLMYALNWVGADIRPDKKYRSLLRPGVVEVVF